MLRNYLIIAYRNLLKNKVFSLINIFGLAIGMAACLLILQYVSFELSYDQFHEKANVIYRVINDRYQNGKLIQHGTITYSPVGAALYEDYEEVVAHTELFPTGEVVVSYQDKKVVATETIATDTSFLTLFSFPVLAGDAKTALQDMHSIVLSASLAQKIFDGASGQFETLIGKTVQLATFPDPFTVTAIIEVPHNSHLQFSLLISSEAVIDWTQNEDSRWAWSDFYHYVQLLPGTNHHIFEKKLAGFSERHFQGNSVSGSVEKFYLQPLQDAYLYSDFEYEIGVTGSGTVVWGLLSIAIIILAIAWINYINLSTASSMERAKEVGIRKVAGAQRGQVIRQYMVEALLVNLLGIIVAFTVIQMTQPSFNNLLEQKLSITGLFTAGSYALIFSLVLITLLGIFLSGFYPAFVLASYTPIKVLRGKFSSSSKGNALRKGLVVAQFATSIALMAAALIVYQQVQFMQKEELGVNLEQVLVIRSPDLTQWDSTYIDRMNSYKEGVRGNAYISQATSSNRVPGQRLGRIFEIKSRFSEEGPRYTSSFMGVDPDFFDLYNIPLLAGRKFQINDYNPDWNRLHHIVLNESAVKLLGFPNVEEAIGETIHIFDKAWEVVGIVADFHQQSLHHPMEPIVFQPTYSTYNPISVKLSTQNLSETISMLEQKYATFFPGNPFDYYFLDERFARQYQQDQLFGKVFGLFTMLALLVSCIGLFGLSSYTIVKRTKEIGIRKVLGASVQSIVILLSKDFIKLLFIASLMALPLAYWVMQRWLENYAFRIEISWWLLSVPIVFVLLISLLTVSFQTIRAALSNPINSLRNE